MTNPFETTPELLSYDNIKSIFEFHSYSQSVAVTGDTIDIIPDNRTFSLKPELSLLATGSGRGRVYFNRDYNPET
jgi:hypothetical protein